MCGSCAARRVPSLMASLGRVLVVDDDPGVSDLLRDALTDFGYTVQVAVATSLVVAAMAAFLAKRLFDEG